MRSRSQLDATIAEVRRIRRVEIAAIDGSKLSRSALNIRRGNVELSPDEMKKAIEISSKEARKAKRAAVAIEVRSAGRVIVKRTRGGGAPRLWAAISKLRSTCDNPAETVTTTNGTAIAECASTSPTNVLLSFSQANRNRTPIPISTPG